MTRVVFDEEFGFRAALEDGFDAVHAEWSRLPANEWKDWPQASAYAGEWKVFGFRIAGHDVERNRRRCPATAALLDTIPGLFTAGYSRLGPRTTLPPHRGERADMLRCHLGLQIPEDCAIVVDGERYRWHEGETFVFDDTAEHEAWNRSDRWKVVLLIDFARPASLPPPRRPPSAQDARDAGFYADLFPEWFVREEAGGPPERDPARAE